MKKLAYTICLMMASFITANAQSKSSITIGGKVFSYDKKSGYGCLFVDSEMVKQGITIGFGNKTAGTKCISKKYGNGVAINFSGLNPNSDYSYAPQQNVLISVTGKWIKKGETYEFYATEWEPFF
ncbi:hypothetical protein [Chryseobacterium koreense]|uniref:hypothetical protein n=1 Tax=Chryseobacterium koreense TaxID=232216 RepID=UPI0026EF9E44|nr:hypothetical protein [Chryseobacterium koreense]